MNLPRRNLVDERLSTSDDRCALRIRFAHLHDAYDLCRDRAHAHGRAVDVVNQLRHLAEQLLLMLPVGSRNYRPPGIGHNPKGFGTTLASKTQPRLVFTRRDTIGAHADIADGIRHRLIRFMTKIPYIAVRAGTGFKRRRRWLGDDAFDEAAFCFLRHAIAESAYHIAAGIQNFEGHLVRCIIDRFIDRIINNGTVRRIFCLLAIPGTAIQTVRVAGLKQMHGLRFDLLIELVQRRDVIQNPEGPPLGGCDQIIVMHPQIRDRNLGKVQLQWLPLAAVIEGNVHARFGSGVQ